MFGTAQLFLNTSNQIATKKKLDERVLLKPEGNRLKHSIQMYCRQKKEKIVFNELNHKFLLEDLTYLKEVLKKEPQLFGLKSTAVIKEWLRYKKQENWTAKDLYQLLVIPHSYPVLEIRGHAIRLPFSFYWKARLEDHQEQIKKVQASVGRLFYKDSNGDIKTSSGFIIKDNLFVSNIEKSNDSAPLSSHKRQAIHPLWVDFSSDRIGDTKRIFFVKKTLKRTPGKKPNVILLLLETVNKTRSTLPSAIRRSSSLSKPHLLLTLGYPSAIYPGQYELVSRAIFGATHHMNIKQAAPGHLVSTEMEGQGHACFKHDCSTAIGSSGSPIIDIKSGEVFGMHSHSYPLEGRSGIGISIAYLYSLLRDVNESD